MTSGTYAVIDATVSMTTLQGSCTCDRRKTEALTFSLVGDDLMLTGEGHDEVLTRTAADAEDFGLLPLYGFWVDDPMSMRFFIPFPIQDLDAPDAG